MTILIILRSYSFTCICILEIIQTIGNYERKSYINLMKVESDNVSVKTLKTSFWSNVTVWSVLLNQTLNVNLCFSILPVIQRTQNILNTKCISHKS